MSKMRQGRVGKPTLARVVGEGIVRTCNMSHKGQVFLNDERNGPSPISRDPGQDKPHMRVPTDKATSWNR